MADANSASLLARSTRTTRTTRTMMATNSRRPRPNVGSVVTNTPTAKLAAISWGMLSPANARSNSAQVPSR
jgi:hypothetical protein